MTKGSLPDLEIGSEIGGCTFLGAVLGGNSGRITYWKLRCECGYEFERRASEHWYYAKNGKKKLCKNKHLHKDIKIGKRFERLTIIDFIKKPYGDEMRGFAVCDCSCGTKGVEVLPESLRNGDTTSCGCFQRESVGNRFRTHGRTDSREFDLWAAAKERAMKEGLPFDIELDDILIPEVCPVLGIPINVELGRGRRKGDSPSLDKFIPEKGYTKGNIAVISWRANWLKNNGTTEEWLKIAKWCQQEDVKRRIQGN
jgi:hypothetical protein